MRVNLRNKAGMVKRCKLGFAWTMLFFGVFVPLSRGDFKWTILALIISGLTLGIGWLVLPFFYNKIYIQGLLENGYEPLNEIDRQQLIARKIIVD
jgi:hypothetical protein